MEPARLKLAAMTKAANIPARYAAIITAAGRGSRAGDGPPKQWRALAGDSVLARSIRAFAAFPRIVVTLAPEDMARGVEELSGPVTLIAGGATRSESVRAALESLEGSGVTHVLIHDGARPLVPAEVIAASSMHCKPAPRPPPRPCPSPMHCGAPMTAASPPPPAARGCFAPRPHRASRWTPSLPPIAPIRRAPPTMSNWRWPPACRSP